MISDNINNTTVMTFINIVTSIKNIRKETSAALKVK